MARIEKTAWDVIDSVGSIGKAANEKYAANYETRNALQFYRMVVAQAGTEAATAQTEVSASINHMTSQGVTLRIPAGGVATLTVSDLADWVYEAAEFSLSLPVAQVALPLQMLGSVPGKGDNDGSYDLTFMPPRFIKGLVFRYGGREDNLSLRASLLTNSSIEVVSDVTFDDHPIKVSDPAAQNAQLPQYEYIGATVSKLSWHYENDPKATPIITAILPNAADMLSIATDADRTLHQVPRTLSFGDEGTSADLAGYLNDAREAGQDSAVFRFSSRTDCVVKIKLGLSRQRRAMGTVEGDLADGITITPWAPVVVSPKLAVGDGVTTTLIAKAKGDGPLQVGLRETVVHGAAQGLVLPPRVAVMQPFDLPETSASSRRFSGVWICLSGPPAQAETLKIDVAQFDSATKTQGDVLATGLADLSGRQMDLVPVGDGVFAHWVAFEDSLDVDTPDLTARFAIIVSDASGPVSLLETAQGLPNLHPALFRDFARSPTWQQRTFGQPAKALVFELGEIAEGTPAQLRVTSGGVSQTHAVPENGADISITVPASPSLVLTADRHVTLENASITSASSTQTLGS